MKSPRRPRPIVAASVAILLAAVAITAAIITTRKRQVSNGGETAQRQVPVTTSTTNKNEPDDSWSGITRLPSPQAASVLSAYGVDRNKTSGPIAGSTPTPSLRPTTTTNAPASGPSNRRPTVRTPTIVPIPVESQEDPFIFTGKLTDKSGIGIKVASGLSVRVLAQSGKPVEYTSVSATQPTSKQCRFHVRPDGAAAFDAGTNNGDWFYCSNAEVKEHKKSANNRCNGGLLDGKCRAGVYCLLIDSDGHVKDYQQRLGGDDTCGYNDGIGPDLPASSTNCQGGVTPWNTYVSCEEAAYGFCWQVDPTGRRMPQKIEALGMSKPDEGNGGWEAMAVDSFSDASCPIFYFTEDRITGKVRRLRPDCNLVGGGARYQGWDMLHEGHIRVDYLEFVGGCSNGTVNSGQFRWTDNDNDASKSAGECYRFTEGIAVARVDLQGFPRITIFFVTKKSDLLFSLNHETTNEGRWQAQITHTNSLLKGEGNFQPWPDQLTVQDDFMYHTTDGSSTPGVYIHNLHSGQYYTLWQIYAIGINEDESVGHALSPDGRFIVGALQKDGRVFLLSREDGKPFRRLDFALRRR